MTTNFSSKAKDAYRNAGVDDNKSSELTKWIQAQSNQFTNTPKKTSCNSKKQACANKQLISSIDIHGDFCSVVDPNFSNYSHPLLVSTTDGVGTKIILADKWNLPMDTIGHDLVAMCANDIYTVGANALGFLDYFATSFLNIDKFQGIFLGMKKALDQCNCQLLGGETAQLPGILADKQYDIAGFMYGVVDKPLLIGKHLVQDGDLLYGFCSDGFHSNGFSLLRKIIDKHALTPKSLSNDHFTAITNPTKLYTLLPTLVSQLGIKVIHAAAHITGGGISENLSRIIADTLYAEVNLAALKNSKVSDFLNTYGDMPWDNYHDLFNLGCGMIVAIDKDHGDIFEKACSQLLQPIVYLGKIRNKSNQKFTKLSTKHSIVFTKN